MNKVKIGIIGTGVGIRTLLPGFRRINEAQVLAICGSKPERSKYFAEKYEIPIAYNSCQELCDNEEIDLVCIASPNNFHFDQVKCAIISSKHILCEKPLVCFKNELDELIALSNKSNKYCMIDHQLRFNPYMIKIRDLISDGNMGDIYYVRLHQQSMGFSNPNAKWSWSFDEKQNGGVRWAMGVHFVDLLLYWFNERMYNISGSMAPVITHRIDNLGIEREIKASTFCTASMISETGIAINLSVSAAALSKPRFDVDIYGTKGELHFDLDEKLKVCYLNQNENVDLKNIDGVYEDEKKNEISIFSGSFRYYATNIIRAILEKDSHYLDLGANFSDAAYTFDILEKIKKAANENCIIDPITQLNSYV